MPNPSSDPLSALFDRASRERSARAIIQLQVPPDGIFMLTAESKTGAQIARPFVNGPQGYLEPTACGPQPVGSLDAALSFAFNADAQGRSVYLATASFRRGWRIKEEVDANGCKTGRTYPLGDRRLANAHRVQVLVVDVDVQGSGHVDAIYRDHAEACAELAQVCRETGLPLPSIIVNSGSGGAHMRWFLTEPLPLDAWRVLAAGLARLLVAAGYHCDAPVTRDAVRLLRLPGMHRHKNGTSSLVHVTAINDPLMHDLETIRAVLDRHGALQPVSPIRRDTTGSIGQWTPAQWPLVRTYCAQVARSHAGGGESDGYELWFAMLRLALHTTDPERAALELSCQYPTFDPNETLDKLAGLRATVNAPPACGTLDILRPGLCETCIFRGPIETPVAIDPQRKPILPAASEVLLEAAKASALSALKSARMAAWTRAVARNASKAAAQAAAEAAEIRARRHTAPLFFTPLLLAPREHVEPIIPQIIYFAAGQLGLEADELIGFMQRVTGRSEPECRAQVERVLMSFERKMAREHAALARTQTKNQAKSRAWSTQ